MKDITKKYTNGEVTIVWKPSQCIHSTVCFHGLAEVFNPSKRPWITPENSTTEKIIEQVKRCPSGALSIDQPGPDKKLEKTITLIEVLHKGPLCVHGNIEVKDVDGNHVSKENKTFLCRCGASSNKPYCDSSHKKIGFTG